MEMIRQPDAIEPLLEAISLALSPQLEAAKEVVTLAQILVPNGQDEHLLVEVMGTGLEVELLIINGIKSAPLDAGLVLFVLVRIGFQLSLKNRYKFYKK